MIISNLNETLKNLISTSEQLESLINKSVWLSKEKRLLATDIVKKLQEKRQIELTDKGNYIKIEVTRIPITLSPIQCGIKDSSTFNYEDILHANKYIISLLNDMNYITKKLTDNLKFRLVGYYCMEGDSKCTFYIVWDI